MIKKGAGDIASCLESLGAGVRASATDVTFTDLAASSTECSKGALFAAFPGSASDGRKYISDAISRGASGIVYELSSADGSGDFTGVPADIPAIGVRDLRKYLPALASFFYDHPAESLHLLGVTGTNGKSSTAWYASLITDSVNKRRAVKGLPSLGRCGIIGTVGNGFPGELHHTANTTPGPIQLERELRRQLDLGATRCLMEVSSHQPLARSSGLP